MPSQKHRPKRPTDREDESHAVLRAIYRPEGGSDLRRLERRPRRGPRRLILLFLGFFVLATLAALLGMRLFTPRGDFSSDLITVELQGAKQAASGDEYVLTAVVKNGGSVALATVDLTLQFPSGFQLLSSTPKAANEFGNLWTLGRLGRGKSKSVKLVGRLLGELNSEKTFLATASFQPENFSSDFLREGSLTTRVTASGIELNIDAPVAVASGQSVTYSVKLTNASEDALRRVRLELTYPEGLQNPTVDPAPSEGKERWEFSEVQKDGMATVTVTGILLGDAGTVTELRARVGVLNDAGTFLVQREQSALVLILGATLNLTLSVDDATSGHPVDQSDTIKVTLSYSNDSEAEFRSASLALSFSGKDSDGRTISLVDPGSLASPTPFTKSDEAMAATWTKDHIKDFERLLPGTRGSVEMTMRLKENLRSLGSGSNYTIELGGSLKARQSGTETDSTATTSVIPIPVTTELRLATEARYFAEDGTALGSGPLPPEVGTTTAYSVRWYVTNSLNGARDVVIATTLPEHVTFVDAEVSGGNNITYDETTRVVRWRLPKVDARVGQTLPTLVGTFRVSITPRSEDVGITPALTGSITLEGTDAFTGTLLQLSAKAVSTDLENDANGRGKGVVVSGSGSPESTNVSGT